MKEAKKTNIKCSGYRKFANILSMYRKLIKISCHTCFYYSCFICAVIKMVARLDLF